jgi:hypothetical protein
MLLGALLSKRMAAVPRLKRAAGGAGGRVQLTADDRACLDALADRFPLLG